jgi:hypothetical protein
VVTGDVLCIEDVVGGGCGGLREGGVGGVGSGVWRGMCLIGGTVGRGVVLVIVVCRWATV